MKKQSVMSIHADTWIVKMAIESGRPKAQVYQISL